MPVRQARQSSAPKATSQQPNPIDYVVHEGGSIADFIADCTIRRAERLGIAPDEPRARPRPTNIRGAARAKLVSELKAMLAAIKRAWMQGRWIRVAELQLWDGMIAHRTNHNAVSEFFCSLHEHVQAKSNDLAMLYPTALERTAFLVGADDLEADHDDAESERWTAAWLLVAEHEGISRAVALDALDQGDELGVLPNSVVRQLRRRRSRRDDASPTFLERVNARLEKAKLPGFVETPHKPWRYP